MAVTIQPPMQWQGTTAQQLQQCYSYLYRLQEQLNLALAQTGPAAASAPAGNGEKTGSPASEAAELKSLIVKNAGLVEKEMEHLQTVLTGRYLAKSEFGTCLEELNARITADPTGISQYYGFVGQLQAALEGAVDETAAEFRDYRVQTEGYIRTGLVAYRGTEPVYGVAVGQGLTVDDDGLIGSARFRSVFTADRLSFWQGDVEVAYMSNNRLYIRDATVLGGIDLGGTWRIDTARGFVIRWIGQ